MIRERKLLIVLVVIIVLLIVGISTLSTSPRLAVDSQPTGFQKDKLIAVANEATTTEKNLHSLIIERHGKIALELYRNGWNTSLSDGGGIFNLWSTIEPETIHDVRSTTKSIVALLAGIVLERHSEYSIHSQISDFPELAAKAPEWAQNLELWQFLSMSSGLSWKEWGYGMFASDETPLTWESDPLKYSLDRPLVTKPGTVFNYSGGSTFIASRMIELIDGRPIEEITQTDLFEPLGITNWKWGKGWNGYYLPNSGIGLRSQDMLKIGELMLAHGNWRGQQIVPANWVDEVTSPILKVQTNYFDLDDQGTAYGYFWWNGTISWLGEDIHWFSTVGNGGQKIFVAPKLELIVVMTAGDYGNPDIQIWETELLKKILASIDE
jgi:CubicO group peptidase (beta-lactamase class C family)